MFKGTRAILDLARAPDPEKEETLTTPPPIPRARVLLLDTPHIVRSMARVPGRHHDVEVAAGVQEAFPR
jgi:hypothetical protein